MISKSFFVSLDGMDGCGKSTQCRLLAETLRQRGHTVTECSDPGSTNLGNRLREVLLHSGGDITPMSEALLFMAGRAQLIHEVIRPALRQSNVVVCDRFLLSTVVYQGHAGGLDADDIHAICLSASQHVQPDLTIVLDLPVELAAERMKSTKDRIENRGRRFYDKVRAGFLKEAGIRPEQIVVIDATPAADVVQQAVLAEVEKRMTGSV